MENRSKLEESKKNLSKIFKENPAIAQAFKDTLDELSTPENLSKMSHDICNVVNKFNKLKNGR